MKDITLYTIDCPKCKQLEKLLNSKNITYTVNKNLDEMKQLGISSAPVLRVDDELLDFAKAWAWGRAYEN